MNPGETYTLKQHRFAVEYSSNGQMGRKAAIAAGYAEKNAHVQSSQLLAMPKIQTLIADEENATLVRAQTTASRVIREFARLAFSDRANYYQYDKDGRRQGVDILELSKDHSAALQEWAMDPDGSVAFKLWPKGPATEALGRLMGLFTDRHEHVVTVDMIKREIIGVVMPETQGAGYSPAPDEPDKPVIIDSQADDTALASTPRQALPVPDHGEPESD